LSGGQVAGSIGAFVAPWSGKLEVTYWIGREFWGKGIATKALAVFLSGVKIRPLYARAAKDNIASLRVLEKCGFTIAGYERGFANARGEEGEEVVLGLRAEAPEVGARGAAPLNGLKSQRQTMAIDYLALSEAYRPAVIRTLLVGEAPPPSGASYFYLPALLHKPPHIRDNRSLPATIFYHYFHQVPESKDEYAVFLSRLKDLGIF